MVQQTCVAPDYVIVPRHFEDKLVEAFKAVYVLPLDNLYSAHACLLLCDT
jgi:acyl-CoA reductase-like NAD-dependent aldehyde dehydrogenase